MRILIYGLNYSPELTGIGKFSGEMGAWLAAQGHDVRAVVAPPYYPDWRVRDGYRRSWYRKELVEGVTVYRCPLFVPRAPRAFTRLVHLTTFALSSAPVLVGQVRWRPDVILTVVPTLLCTPGALLVGALCGAKSVLHIQDFELDAMVGLGLGRDGRLVRAARHIERWLMRRFDAISSISQSMLELARIKTGHSHLLYVPNWVDTQFIGLRRPTSSFRAAWGIGPATRVVLYSGNVGAKQGLETVLEIAESFVAEDVVFVIVGAGAAYASLEGYARAKGLTNVLFRPIQPYEQLPDLLSLADVHLVIQRKGVADLVMPSKLTAILAAAGHALITASPGTELFRLCEENPGVAWCVEPESPRALGAGLRAMLASPDVQARRGNAAARAYAEAHLSKDTVLTAMIRDLSALVENCRA